MLRMMESTHQTGKVVTHYNGFCVTARILELHIFGVDGQTQIKKQGRYWPCNVPGHVIDEHFPDKEIGSRESLKQTINGIEFLYIVKGRRNMFQKLCQLMGQ